MFEFYHHWQVLFSFALSIFLYFYWNSIYSHWKSWWINKWNENFELRKTQLKIENLNLWKKRQELNEKEKEKSVGNEKTVFLDSRIDKTWINLFSASQPHAHTILKIQKIFSANQEMFRGKKDSHQKKFYFFWTEIKNIKLNQKKSIANEPTKRSKNRHKPNRTGDVLKFLNEWMNEYHQ